MHTASHHQKFLLLPIAQNSPQMEPENYVPPKDDEELELEKLVFGDGAGFEANLRKIENLYDYSDEEDLALQSDFGAHSESDSEHNDEDMFFIDDGGDSAVKHVPEANNDDMELDANDSDEAAWIDSDDEKTSVSVVSTRAKKLRTSYDEQTLSGAAYVARLRSQFEKIYPRPQWADSFEESGPEFVEEDAEDAAVGMNVATLAAILASTDQYVKRTTKLLPPTRIEILRLKDANVARRSRGGIQSMCFHLLHPLLMTGGFDRTLRIYHIDGRTNKFVSLVHFRDLPVQTCQFAPGSDLVYAAGRRRYMNRWNISSGAVDKISRMYGHDKFQRSYEYFKVGPTGRFVALLGSSGWVNLVNAATGQFATAVKVDGFVADFVFAADENSLLVANHAGDMWEFDLSAEPCTVIRRWTDAGAVTVTALAYGGPGDRWLAVGTKSGVVQLYDRTTFAVGTPKPFREVGNLVTEISTLEFSPDGQILCIASKQKKDAMKLVHMPLGTVFANWPTSGTPLGRVTTARFSPDGQMLAVGNDVGRVTLWRLNHY